MRPFIASAGVALALTACAHGAENLPPTRSARAVQSAPLAERYGFAKAPIVVFAGNDPDSEHNINFYVFVRTTRALPRDGRGIKAKLLLDGIHGDGVPFTDSTKPPCYSTEIGANNDPGESQTFTKPTDGQKMKVTVRFPGVDGARAIVAARKVSAHAVGFDQADAVYLRKLRCHGNTH